MKTGRPWSRLWAALGRGARPEATTEATERDAARAFEVPPLVRELAGGAEFDAIRAVERGSAQSCARALEALRSAAGTPLEHQALAACVAAHARRRAPGELLCLAAELFTRRGDPETALRLLEGLDEPGGWLLEADLRAELGQHAAALALVERALAYSIDAPGALDRLRRWRPPKRVAPGATQPTLLAAQSPHATLRISAEAGRGGSATVYHAEDRTLGRSVALKVYHRPESSREQLLREARMAVRFGGMGVVRVFDAAADAGWLAMEWVARGSLRQCLNKIPAETPPLDATLRGLLATLARIHEAGYVHADVKPGNILFRADGGVLLSDFGLSVPLGAPHLGQSGGYAPPERLQGGPAVAADDLYALGRVILEVLEVGHPDPNTAFWRELAALLTGPERPLNAGVVLALLPPADGNR